MDGGDFLLGSAPYNNKRTHDQMATGRRTSQSLWTYTHPEYIPSLSSSDNMSSSSDRLQSRLIGFPRLLLPGDSMESRTLPPPRPSEFVGPSRLVSHTVIDLTGDESPSPPLANTRGQTQPSTTRTQRAPWFPRDIIDVDALPDSPDRRSAALRHESPELELTFSRPRVAGRVDLRRPAFQPVEPSQMYSSAPRAPSRTAVGTSNRGTMTTGGHQQDQPGTRGSRSVWDTISMIRLRHEAEPSQRRPRESNTIDGAPPIPASFPVPVLDYRDVGFGLTRDVSPDEPVIVSGKHKYDAPPPARDGFTRSPHEGDVIVCPNCDDELTVGDDDLKRSVWVAKCGHVYCGDCTKNRSQRMHAKKKSQAQAPKPKPKHPPFAVCRVDGCDFRVHQPTSMFQVYL